MLFFIESSDARCRVLYDKLLKLGESASFFDRSEHFIVPTWPLDGREWAVVLPPNLPSDQAFSLLSQLPCGAWVFAGPPGEKTKHLVNRLKLNFVNLMEDEPFLIQNAASTAEGAILLLLGHAGRTLPNLDMAVAGFGRIGKLLCLKLRALGARVVAISRNPVQDAWARALSIRCASYEALEEMLPRLDALINTVPAIIFDESHFQKMKESALYIELAKGCDPNRTQGVKFVPAPGLPGKTAPETAADDILNVILRRLHEQGGAHND